MLGKNFTAGMAYRDECGWVRVKTRGPVITQGVDRPMVRLTVEDDEAVRRATVYADRDYETRAGTASPARREWIVPSAPQPDQQATSRETRTSEHTRRRQATTKSRRRKPRPAALSSKPGPAPLLRPTAGSAARPQDIVVAAPDHEYCEEACYWLPPNTHHVTATQYAILDALSQLLWVDAPSARWRDGELVEHDAPIGLTSYELTAAVQQVEQATARQVRSLERMVKGLIQRKLVERTTSRRYRLRGWQCLHTRRRVTRRAIERGGGRAMYAYVRHSA